MHLHSLFRAAAHTIAILLSLYQYQSHAQASSLKGPTELPVRSGFAILNVEAPGGAFSINVQKLGSYKTSVRTLSFGHDPEARLEIFALPEGRYQITQVSAPYFNLPYQLDTKDDPVWQFIVENKKSSYIGTLKISKERSAKYVDISFINRTAKDLPLIRAQLSDTIARFPLRSGSVARDDYQLELDKVLGGKL